MKKTIIVLILFAGAATAQTLTFDNMRGSYRVVTNEQDVVALASNAFTRAMVTAIQAGTTRWETAYGWGDWNPRMAGMEGRTNAWNAGTALAGTALQPSWAASGTVSRAEAAAMLATADGDVWTEIGTNGLLWLVQVTNTLSVIVTATSGEGYNGPDAGTLFSGPAFMVDPDYLWWEQSAPAGYDMSVYGDLRPDYSHLQGFVVTRVDPYTQWSCDGTLPGAFVPVIGEGDPVGTFAAEWVYATNRYQIATQVGTVILLTEHNADGDAHPTLPRYVNVTSIVDAATSPLVGTNHTGNVQIAGAVAATSFSGSGASLTDLSDYGADGWTRVPLHMMRSGRTGNSMVNVTFNTTNFYGVASTADQAAFTSGAYFFTSVPVGRSNHVTRAIYAAADSPDGAIITAGCWPFAVSSAYDSSTVYDWSVASGVATVTVTNIITAQSGGVGIIVSGNSGTDNALERSLKYIEYKWQ